VAAGPASWLRRVEGAAQKGRAGAGELPTQQRRPYLIRLARSLAPPKAQLNDYHYLRGSWPLHRWTPAGSVLPLLVPELQAELQLKHKLKLKLQAPAPTQARAPAQRFTRQNKRRRM